MSDKYKELEDLIRPVTKATVTSVNGVRTFNDLKNMSELELLALRDEIDQLLPATKLPDLNLAEELVLQFQKVKALQAKTLDDDRTSAQQKSAVVNSCVSALGQVVKMQTDLYNAERMKTIEQVLIAVMRDQPAKVQQAFFDKYEKALSK